MRFKKEIEPSIATDCGCGCCWIYSHKESHEEVQLQTWIDEQHNHELIAFNVVTYTNKPVKSLGFSQLHGHSSNGSKDEIYTSAADSYCEKFDKAVSSESVPDKGNANFESSVAEVRSDTSSIAAADYGNIPPKNNISINANPTERELDLKSTNCAINSETGTFPLPFSNKTRCNGLSSKRARTLDEVLVSVGGALTPTNLPIPFNDATGPQLGEKLDYPLQSDWPVALKCVLDHLLFSLIPCCLEKVCHEKGIMYCPRGESSKKTSSKGKVQSTSKRQRRNFLSALVGDNRSADGDNRQDGDENSGDGGMGRRLPSPALRNAGLSPHFACVLYKFDRKTYFRCAGSPFENPTRVRQHLIRSHHMKDQFDQDSDESRRKCGIKSWVDQWYALWDRVTECEPRPETPYLDDSDVLYAIKTGADTILPRSVDSVLRERNFEQCHDLQALVEDSARSALAQFLRECANSNSVIRYFPISNNLQVASATGADSDRNNVLALSPPVLVSEPCKMEVEGSPAQNTTVSELPDYNSTHAADSNGATTSLGESSYAGRQNNYEGSDISFSEAVEVEDTNITCLTDSDGTEDAMKDSIHGSDGVEETENALREVGAVTNFQQSRDPGVLPSSVIDPRHLTYDDPWNQFFYQS